MLVSFLVALRFLSSQAEPASIDKALESELAETRTPGAALVVVRGGDVLLSKGYGVASVETREPQTPLHLFILPGADGRGELR